MSTLDRDVLCVIWLSLVLAMAGGVVSALIRVTCERAWHRQEQRASSRIAEPRERNGG